MENGGSAESIRREDGNDDYDDDDDDALKKGAWIIASRSLPGCEQPSKYRHGRRANKPNVISMS